MNINLGKTTCLELCGPGNMIPSNESSMVDFHVDGSWKGDHAPRFSIFLAVRNFRLFEVSWYDTRHEDAR